MANAPTIQKNFDLFTTRMKVSPSAEEEILTVEEEPPVTVAVEPAAPKPSVTIEQKPKAEETVKTTQPEKKPAVETQTKPQTKTQTQTQTQTKPPPKTQTQTQTTTQNQKPSQTAAVQTRDRAIYFANVGGDGQILHAKVTRKIPVSDSPMQDALNVLLAGPTMEELNRGLINLVPKNTRILSATVRGNTAYISFSEDFLFNTFGVEGYVAQLRQIVWTVTEFQNVKDVQILIEGRRMDYLGEGIWIGSPISRQSF